jgi:protein-tyrosine phosphatase
VIDLHSHILPGVDDGPATLEASLELARVAVQNGTETIAATPHIDHAHAVDPAQIPVAVAALNMSLTRAEIPLRVVPGAEVAVTRLLELEASVLRRLRLGDGPWLLVEAPLGYAPNHFEQIIIGLREQGHEVLLAHPERSVHFQRDGESLRRLVDMGVRSSITAGSMAGQFGETVRRHALEMLSAGLVHNVASDAHDHRRRSPVLREGFALAEQDLPGITAQLGWYTQDVPAAILAGLPLPEAPLPPRRRRRRLGLGRLRARG